MRWGKRCSTIGAEVAFVVKTTLDTLYLHGPPMFGTTLADLRGRRRLKRFRLHAMPRDLSWSGRNPPRHYSTRATKAIGGSAGVGCGLSLAQPPPPPSKVGFVSLYPPYATYPCSGSPTVTLCCITRKLGRSLVGATRLQGLCCGWAPCQSTRASQREHPAKGANSPSQEPSQKGLRDRRLCPCHPSLPDIYTPIDKTSDL